MDVKDVLIPAAPLVSIDPVASRVVIEEHNCHSLAYQDLLSPAKYLKPFFTSRHPGCFVDQLIVFFVRPFAVVIALGDPQVEEGVRIDAVTLPAERRAPIEYSLIDRKIIIQERQKINRNSPWVMLRINERYGVRVEW